MITGVYVFKKGKDTFCVLRLGGIKHSNRTSCLTSSICPLPSEIQQENDSARRKEANRRFPFFFFLNKIELILLNL